MNVLEFSAQFDTLFNNITSNQAIGLNEYEKSVFLTKAQSQLIREYFNNRTDGVGGGFDGTQKRQYDFSKLIETADLALNLVNDPEFEDTYAKVDSRSVVIKFPEEYFLSINEVYKDDKYQYTVIPISYDEYARLMMKPYALPVKKAVWRLFTGTFGNRVVAEIIGKGTKEVQENGFGTEGHYILRYIRKPKPIILDDLDEYGVGVSIENRTEATECELPEEMHEEILERAITLAKIAWAGSTATVVANQNKNN